MILGYPINNPNNHQQLRAYGFVHQWCTRKAVVTPCSPSQNWPVSPVTIVAWLRGTHCTNPYPKTNRSAVKCYFERWFPGPSSSGDMVCWLKMFKTSSNPQKWLKATFKFWARLVTIIKPFGKGTIACLSFETELDVSFFMMMLKSCLILLASWTVQTWVE